MNKSTSLGERVRSGVVWNALSTLSFQGGTFLTNLLVANVLGADRFGQFSVCINTAQTTGAVLQFSTGLAATKYIAEFRRTDRELASRALGLCQRVSLRAGLVGGLGLGLLAPLIGSRVLDTPELGLQLAIAAPIVLFSILTGFQMGAIAGLEGFRSAARVALPLAAVQVVSVAAAARWFDFTGATIGICTNFALRTLACHWVLHREAVRQGIRPTSGDGRFERSAFVGFLLPASLTGLTAMPSMWVATVALARSTAGFSEVAYFNAAFAIRTVLMIFPWILSSVMLSLLSHHLAGDRRAQFGRLLLVGLAASLAAVVIGQVFVLLAGRSVVMLYGERFLAALPVLHVLMISFAAEALALPLYQVLTSRGRMWRFLAFALLPRDLLVVGLALVWLEQHGGVGLAWAHSVAYTFSLMAAAGLVWLSHRGNPGRFR